MGVEEKKEEEGMIVIEDTIEEKSGATMKIEENTYSAYENQTRKLTLQLLLKTNIALFFVYKYHPLLLQESYKDNQIANCEKMGAECKEQA